MFENPQNIRNFCIIAHVDHGKSTLADRLLEATGTVEKRRMKAQYLDQMDLERERGITIKMTPVRMKYKYKDVEYTLNLIDTPGHSDFSYEVSRALAAVDGAILLVDATQGIQAQTLANFNHAQKAGLKIIGAVNKVDLNPYGADEIARSISELTGENEKDVLRVSGKTGQGVEELLKAIIERIPPPTSARNTSFSPKPPQLLRQGSLVSDNRAAKQRGQASESLDEQGGLREKEIFRALIFDSFYHEHKGIVANIRVFNGSIKREDEAYLVATDTNFKIKELGHFAPELKTDETIGVGQIGYIATGLKNPEALKIGDTITEYTSRIQDYGQLALPGYQNPQPVVFVSFYPEEADDYESLKMALGKLKLNDSALKFEPDSNEFLGRGFKGGFLGRLHFEITAERLEREFNLRTINSFPSVSYKVKKRNGEWINVDTPKDFPSDYLEVLEPVSKIEIVTPTEYLGAVMRLQENFRLRDINTRSFGNSIVLNGTLPVAELIRDFDDQLKSVSAGYASLSYEVSDYKKTEVVKLEILVAEHNVGGLTRIVYKNDMEHEARKTVERLKELLPRQQFTQAIQATIGGKIVARETIAAMKKELGNFGKNGGDRTRKMKLWKKQQRGKERLKERGTKNKIDIPAGVFKELLKK
ncbi:MAG: GTP-binding protein [Patescibacteria group bacterium]|nr:GTP-binding protein [Patescibacteria group bacterium]